MFLYANALYLKTRRKKLQKFDAKVDKGVFLKYPTSSKAFSVFNKRTVTIEESFHVTFDDYNPKSV